MKNYFFKDFGQKWKVKDGSVVFQKIFNRGFTVAVFSSCGTMPVVRDVLMMLAMVSKRMSRLSYRSVVEMGLRSQDFAGLLLIIFKTKPSMTGSKVCKGSPVKEVSEEAIWFERRKLFLIVQIFSMKCSEETGDHQSQKLKEEVRVVNKWCWTGSLRRSRVSLLYLLGLLLSV